VAAAAPAVSCTLQLSVGHGLGMPQVSPQLLLFVGSVVHAVQLCSARHLLAVLIVELAFSTLCRCRHGKEYKASCVLPDEVLF
jgi:hypothetical protein